MLTCRASRIEPLAWLRHVLIELPQRAGDADIDDLLPFNLHKTATGFSDAKSFRRTLKRWTGQRISSSPS